MGHSDAEEILNLEAVIFAKQNAVVRRVGISQEDWHRFAKGDSKGFERSGLSMVMRDREASGKIVAFVLGHTLGSAESASFQEMRRLCRKYPYAWDLGMVSFPTILRAYLLEWSLVWVALQRRVARCAAGGTVAGYEGLGLQGQLRSEFIKLARIQGYDRIVVETISPATCHLWTKLGFDKMGFKSWESRTRKDGCTPFEGIEGGTAVHQLILNRRPMWNLVTFLLASGSVVAAVTALKAAVSRLRRYKM